MNLWLIAFTVMLPTLITVIDTSVVNVALDHIRGSLSATYDESTFAITAYLVSNAIIIPMAAWFSRLIGRKNFLLGSIVLFTVSSFLCGSAWSLQSLVFFRIVQGIGGGGLAPISQSILQKFSPRKTWYGHGYFRDGYHVGPHSGSLDRWLDNRQLVLALDILYQHPNWCSLDYRVTAIVIKDPPYMKRQKMKIDYWGLAASIHRSPVLSNSCLTKGSGKTGSNQILSLLLPL